jgi:hypothetical protein
LGEAKLLPAEPDDLGIVHVVILPDLKVSTKRLIRRPADNRGAEARRGSLAAETSRVDEHRQALYRGVKVLLLAMTAAEKSHASPFWGTYQQDQRLRRADPLRGTVFFKQHQIPQPGGTAGTEPASPVVL